MYFGLAYGLSWLCLYMEPDPLLRFSPSSPVMGDNLWQRVPSSQVTVGLQCLYVAQFSFYLADLFFLMAPPLGVASSVAQLKRRPDHWVYVLHHCVTLGLLDLSWHWGWTRSGLVIMFLHDVSDVFVRPLAVF
jgi:hypothetical protein